MKFLEINKETDMRFLGGYGEAGSIKAILKAWLQKVGDTIETGPLVMIDFTEMKGEVTVEAADDEIGMRIAEIFVPEGSTCNFDLLANPLKLARFEKAGERPVEARETPAHPLRATPVARRIAEKEGIDIADVARNTGEGSRIKKGDVRKFAESGPVRAAPLTRKIAKGLGVSIETVPPSKSHGIITESDVRREARVSQAAPAPVSAISEEALGYASHVLSSDRRGIARAMKESLEIPHAGDAVSFDPARLLAVHGENKAEFLKFHGIKLRLDYFFAAACASLLTREKFRVLNAYFSAEKEEIRIYKHVNIGFAVSAPASPGELSSTLFVPNVKQAEALKFGELAKQADRVIASAVARTLSLADKAHTTFIVNNTGVLGGEFPEPRIAPRTAAIVAFGAPHGNPERMNIVLRFDHRMFDGRDGMEFLAELKKLMEHPERIFLI